MKFTIYTGNLLVPRAGASYFRLVRPLGLCVHLSVNNVGSGGMLPQDIFFKIWYSEIASKALFGSFLKPGTERNNGGTFRPVPPTKIRNNAWIKAHKTKTVITKFLIASWF